MELFKTSLDGLASLAWPIVIVIFVLCFRREIISVLNSLKTRGFSVKVGENELTTEEASAQQSFIIKDILNQIGHIEKRLEVYLESYGKERREKESNETDIKVRSILWVDNKPRNNSYLIAYLSDLGIRIDTSVSTSEAIQKFQSSNYDRIITNMIRPESERAGIELTKQIRDTDRDIPIIIYCGTKSANVWRQEARNIGANEITDSPSKLLHVLHLETK